MAMFARYLSDDGTSSGNKNANGNYSGAVEEWYIEATGKIEIARMIVSIEDGGGGQIQEYGNLGGALSNGIEVKLLDENDVVQIDRFERKNKRRKFQLFCDLRWSRKI